MSGRVSRSPGRLPCSVWVFSVSCCLSCSLITRLASSGSAFFFLLDPINNLARQKSALSDICWPMTGASLSLFPLSALICGFFWEMWNSLALPKWIYTIPFLNSSPALLPAHLFEMPLLGYTGYLPFALELFAMYQFVLLITGRHKDNLTF